MCLLRPPDGLARAGLNLVWKGFVRLSVINISDRSEGLPVSCKCCDRSLHFSSKAPRLQENSH